MRVQGPVVAGGLLDEEFLRDVVTIKVVWVTICERCCVDRLLLISGSAQVV